MVEGLTPAEVLQRLGARSHIEVTGASELVEPAFRTWDAHHRDRQFIGATAISGWVLGIEPNGYRGVTESVAIPLSAGTRLVSHFCNINSVDDFYWIENGDIRLRFEPLFPIYRTGSDPDGLVEVMRQVGFDMQEDTDRSFELTTEAAFALAEHITGVRLTPEFLDSATFLCGTTAGPTA